MTARGKPGKPKAGFPPFPPSLESPQKQRASHIPTAWTTGPYISGKTKQGRPYGRALKPSTRRVGQNKLPKWAKSSCQTQEELFLILELIMSAESPSQSRAQIAPLGIGVWT